jgi:hypothetical protein
MREDFSNKRKAGNLLTAAIMTLSSLSNGVAHKIVGYTHTPSYVGVALQSFMFESPGTGQLWRMQAVRMHGMHI